MQEILGLIDKYIDAQHKFWSDEHNEDYHINSLEWAENEWALIDEIELIKKQIMNLIENDNELFNKYLLLGSCIKHEEYEQAEIFKNEILNYGKTA